ncbi:MAG TPA: hypothetical protein VFP59_20145 [Candidatus Angelobacter sp.]|nr:hypothetical protein [Candidatus Angelobacter sp.]
MKAESTRRFHSLLLAVVLVLLPELASPGSLDPDESMRAATPAGYKVIQLQPSGAVVSLLALIECPQIRGAHRVASGLNSRVVLANGTQLRRFPRQFSFRVTASLRRVIAEPPSLSLNYGRNPEDLLLGLKFKLRDYNALVAKEIRPESVRLIGMPAHVPYDERVFRVSFDIGNRPVTDRVLLEVYAPDGERLGKFCFELL